MDQHSGVMIYPGVIGFQVDNRLVLQKMLVTFKETCGYQPFQRLFGLGVGESDPYTAYLIAGKERAYKIDAGAEKNRVLYPFAQGLFGSFPHAGPFDVDAYEIVPGIAAGQVDRVFPLATPQLQDDGLVVVKNRLVPPAFHLVIFSKDFFKRRFYHIVEPLHLGKTLQLVFAHVTVFLLSE
jgi:hypothetical protein